MPTYEYVCTDCGNGWEEFQKISEDPTQVCPKCGQSTAKRQISGGNFILKGGGWYADLYSSSKPKTGGGESKSESSSTPSTSSSETKPSGGGDSGAKSGSGSSGSSAPKADSK
jgi:putative FmdB family regulatory protein